MSNIFKTILKSLAIALWMMVGALSASILFGEDIIYSHLYLFYIGLSTAISLAVIPPILFILKKVKVLFNNVLRLIQENKKQAINTVCFSLLLISIVSILYGLVFLKNYFLEHDVPELAWRANRLFGRNIYYINVRNGDQANLFTDYLDDKYKREIKSIMVEKNVNLQNLEEVSGAINEFIMRKNILCVSSFYIPANNSVINGNMFVENNAFNRACFESSIFLFAVFKYLGYKPKVIGFMGYETEDRVPHVGHAALLVEGKVLDAILFNDKCEFPQVAIVDLDAVVKKLKSIGDEKIKRKEEETRCRKKYIKPPYLVISVSRVARVSDLDEIIKLDSSDNIASGEIVETYTKDYNSLLAPLEQGRTIKLFFR